MPKKGAKERGIAPRAPVGDDLPEDALKAKKKVLKVKEYELRMINGRTPDRRDQSPNTRKQLDSLRRQMSVVRQMRSAARRRRERPSLNPQAMMCDLMWTFFPLPISCARARILPPSYAVQFRPAEDIHAVRTEAEGGAVVPSPIPKGKPKEQKKEREGQKEKFGDENKKPERKKTAPLDAQGEKGQKSKEGGKAPKALGGLAFINPFMKRAPVPVKKELEQLKEEETENNTEMQPTSLEEATTQDTLTQEEESPVSAPLQQRQSLQFPPPGPQPSNLPPSRSPPRPAAFPQESSSTPRRSLVVLDTRTGTEDEKPAAAPAVKKRSAQRRANAELLAEASRLTDTHAEADGNPPAAAAATTVPRRLPARRRSPRLCDEEEKDKAQAQREEEKEEGRKEGKEKERKEGEEKEHSSSEWEEEKENTRKGARKGGKAKTAAEKPRANGKRKKIEEESEEEKESEGKEKEKKPKAQDPREEQEKKKEKAKPKAKQTKGIIQKAKEGSDGLMGAAGLAGLRAQDMKRNAKPTQRTLADKFKRYYLPNGQLKSKYTKAGLDRRREGGGRDAKRLELQDRAEREKWMLEDPLQRVHECFSPSVPRVEVDELCTELFSDLRKKPLPFVDTSEFLDGGDSVESEKFWGRGNKEGRDRLLSLSVEEQIDTVLPLFGHSAFLPGQKKALLSVLSGRHETACSLSQSPDKVASLARNTLLMLSTGGGKSLVFQLSSVILQRVHRVLTVVVSPLLALMEDQVSRLPRCVRGATISSNYDRRVGDVVIRACAVGLVDVLFVTPEKFSSEIFRSQLDRAGVKIGLVCVDECHCLSEWSHTFRPAYLSLGSVISQRLRPSPVTLALTATATQTTVEDICEQLSIPQENVVGGAGCSVGVQSEGVQGQGRLAEASGWVLRSNLRVTVSRETSKDVLGSLENLLKLEEWKRMKSIVVYVWKKMDADHLARKLGGRAKRVDVYHADKTAANRRKIQREFMEGKLRIVVATLAFGMGIDKSDIDGVIHYSLPKSLEQFVQETGRCARDGRIGRCHVFLRDSDFRDMRNAEAASALNQRQLETFVRGGLTHPEQEGERRENGRPDQDKGSRTLSREFLIGPDRQSEIQSSSSTEERCVSYFCTVTASETSRQAVADATALRSEEESEVFLALFAAESRAYFIEKLAAQQESAAAAVVSEEAELVEAAAAKAEKVERQETKERTPSSILSGSSRTKQPGRLRGEIRMSSRLKRKKGDGIHEDRDTEAEVAVASGCPPPTILSRSRRAQTLQRPQEPPSGEKGKKKTERGDGKQPMRERGRDITAGSASAVPEVLSERETQIVTQQPKDQVKVPELRFPLSLPLLVFPNVPLRLTLRFFRRSFDDLTEKKEESEPGEPFLVRLRKEAPETLKERQGVVSVDVVPACLRLQLPGGPEELLERLQELRERAQVSVMREESGVVTIMREFGKPEGTFPSSSSPSSSSSSSAPSNSSQTEGGGDAEVTVAFSEEDLEAIGERVIKKMVNSRSVNLEKLDACFVALSRFSKTRFSDRAGDKPKRLREIVQLYFRCPDPRALAETVAGDSGAVVEQRERDSVESGPGKRKRVEGETGDENESAKRRKREIIDKALHGGSLEGLSSFAGLQQGGMGSSSRQIPEGALVLGGQGRGHGGGAGNAGFGFPGSEDLRRHVSRLVENLLTGPLSRRTKSYHFNGRRIDSRLRPRQGRLIENTGGFRGGGLAGGGGLQGQGKSLAHLVDMRRPGGGGKGMFTGGGNGFGSLGQVVQRSGQIEVCDLTIARILAGQHSSAVPRTQRKEFPGFWGACAGWEFERLRRLCDEALGDLLRSWDFGVD
uniref:DNA 3'-5' helicase n=1 Tax=Chromera velia CCMP2878 TaxID=1169474 RepID=A0A0G4HUJ8_9ALVE|eukprot:Cvel_8663.t1-p1 / transcript=Cvel_8663.t1 / gene=Cvel_8663 / organism=Chromera_velia_CCMP2878 / gene_product=ATP-dependent DNA helicase Q4, putative / transcript_product=ATP-dependent DNA helicase Q4, putative / location=Cvel_scaffold483:33314-44402(+) / protein_length=1827 / sequence_SO=supercontig / SO=protein_coding / is_pseudo=false